MWPTPLAPHPLSEEFSLYAAGNRLWSKQVRTRELKEPGELTRSHCEREYHILHPS